MATEPNTIVKLLFGVPLNPTYEGTLTFADADEQYAYFNSKNPILLTSQSYQRYDEGSITVNLPVARLYTCDYMMFQNAFYDDKWFYAFVTNVEYINDVTTKVYYQIDVMQTWLLGVDWEFDNCFIDREHTNDDTIGANILPEPFETGDFVLKKQGFFDTGEAYSNYGMILAGYCRLAVQFRDGSYPENPAIELDAFLGTTYSTPVVKIENTVYNLCYNYLPFTTNHDKTVAMNVLKHLMNGDFWDTFNNNMVGVYIVPERYVGNKYYEEVNVDTHGATLSGRIVTCDAYGLYDSAFGIDTDYTPVCNKLYTEQFMSVNIKGIQGVGSELPIDSIVITRDYDGEGGYTHNIHYRIQGGVYGGGGYRFTPKAKEGAFQRAFCLDTGNINEIPFTASGFYSAFGNLALSTISTVLRAYRPARRVSERTQVTTDKTEKFRVLKSGEQKKYALSKRRKKITESEESPASFNFPLAGVIDNVAGYNAPKLPDGVVPISSMIDNINGCFTFSYEIYAPNTVDLRNIDNYLNTFGYSSNRIGIPNVNTRRKWNYLKTKWCNLKNSRCPTDALIDIKEIINNGITFWHGETNVNNYVLTNGKPNPNEVVN